MRSLRVAVLTAALLVLPATAAWAHPSFNPNAVPIGEAVDAVLVVPHGCSTTEEVMPEEGQAVATTRFDLQLLDGVTVEPREVEGWTAEDDGEAIVWTDAGGATTDPIELPVTITVTDGAPGDQLSLSAYQECEDGSSYRWTEGSEGTPPVRLELTEGEAGTVDTGDGMDHGSEMDMGTETGSEMDMDTETAMADDTGDGESATALDAESTAEEATSPTVIIVLVLVALVVAGAIAVAVRRRSA